MADRRPTGFGTSLTDVQASLYDLITAPEGVAQRLAELGRRPEDLARVVRPSDRLSAVERVDVYANMYFYRILDVLRDEYEKVVVRIGDAAFHNVVTDYLLACRPAHPSLREVGARFPEFVRGHPLVAERPWLGELARLERARLELFDGPDAQVLTLDAVRAIDPEKLGALSLRAIPCHRLLRNRFPISVLWKAPAGVDSAALPEEPETLLVWRPETTVFHRAVPADEESLLELVASGTRFEVACERLLATGSEETAVIRAFELLARWASDGLVRAPE